jgi:hypothetical protein
MSLFHFNNPLVRQLAWVMCSPNLLAPLKKSERRANAPELVWDISCRQYYQRFQDQLLRLDQDPTVLQEFMRGCGSPRLGIQFECLLEYWLRWIVAEPQDLQTGLVLQKPGEQTVGQLDFVWHDAEQAWHWEAAVKFYLYHPGLSQPNWLGPNANDSFESKLNHLIQHQLPVAHGELARQLFADTRFAQLRSALFLKGYLFYPLAQDPADPAASVRLGGNTRAYPARSQQVIGMPLSAAHLKGWWQHFPYRSMPRVSTNSAWLVLPKSLWLGPQCFEPQQLQQQGLQLLDDNALQTYCGTHFKDQQRALMILEMTEKHGRYYEISRGMLVAPTWPDLPQYRG